MLTLTTCSLSLMIDWDGTQRRVKCNRPQISIRKNRGKPQKHCKVYIERSSFEESQYPLGTYICIPHRRKLTKENKEHFVGGYNIVHGWKPAVFDMDEYEKEVCTPLTRDEKMLGYKTNILWES